MLEQLQYRVYRYNRAAELSQEGNSGNKPDFNAVQLRIEECRTGGDGLLPGCKKVPRVLSDLKRLYN